MLRRLLVFALITLPLTAGSLLLMAVWWVELGFSPTWWLVSLAPAIPAVVWLARARPAKGGRRLVLGLLVVSAGIIAVGRALLTPQPNIPEGTHPATLELSVGNMPLVEGFYDFEPNDETVVIFRRPNERPVQVDVFFPYLSIQNGSTWGIEEGVALVRCTDTTPDCPTGANEYPIARQAVERNENAAADAEPDRAQPYARVEFTLSDAQIHTRFVLDVRTTVAYIDPATAEERTQDFEREIEVFVGAPAEFETRILVNRYRVLENILTESPGANVIAGVTVVGVAVALWGFLAARGNAGKLARLARRDMRLLPADPDRYGMAISPPTDGAYVERVASGSIWEYAGIQPHDTILRVNGEAVLTPGSFYRALTEADGGTSLSLAVWRNGDILQLMLHTDVQRKDKAKAEH